MAWQSFGAQYMGTNRTMELLLYIIICLVLNDEVNSAFEVKKVLNPLSWETASHRCKETRRNLNFAVPVVNLSSMTVLDEISLQGDAWVGYFQTYEHFLFIVCVPLSEIESSVSAKFIIGSLDNRPGMCYSLCGLQRYIGLQDDVCYCIETRTFSTPDIQSVNSSCEDPLRCVTNGMLCGNREYNKISVYQKVSISSNDRIRGDGSGCLILTKRREFEISVANCSDRFQHLCESNTGLNQYLEESPTNEQWVHSIRDCPKTGKKPTTFIGDKTKFVFPTNDGSWWTSVVRDLVIRNFSESMTITGTPLYEGFLRNSNDGIKLEFVDAKKCSRKQFVACMSGNDNEASTPEVKGTEKRTSSEEQACTLMSHSTHETTIALVRSEQPRNAQENRTYEPTENPLTSATSEAPTMSRIPGNDNEASTPEVKGTEKRTSSEEQASTLMSHSTHETTIALMRSEQPRNAQENRTYEPTENPLTSATSEAPTMSRIPVILPVGLAALALITVVTLSVVFWRRREKKATTNEEPSKQTFTETVVPHNSETQQAYYEHKKEALNQLEENDQSHVSSEYDSLKEYNTPFSAPTGNLYDTSNFNIGKETYAVTFSANTLRQVVQANSYDHVRMKKTNDGKYDHVELQDIGTYDQRNALALDNTSYDTFQEKFNLHQQLEGNVYNTANFHPTK